METVSLHSVDAEGGKKPLTEVFAYIKELEQTVKEIEQLRKQIKYDHDHYVANEDLQTLM